ncbi:hypothetical protein BHM03_00026121 [Ensete ventricosum]|nr:hypothetical protein BHM03_00026121 [Ensete ventricosum]
MHLMTFMEVVRPRWHERALVLAVQGVFFNAYFLGYLVSPKFAHRVTGYLEEEAVHSYTEYLKDLEAGKIDNVSAPPTPPIAIDYWRLPADATLKDVVVVVRADEAHHQCKRTDGSCIAPPPVFPPGEEAERLKCYYLLSEVEFLGTSSTEHESARLQSVSWDLLVASTLAEAFMSRDRP